MTQIDLITITKEGNINSCQNENNIFKKSYIFSLSLSLLEPRGSEPNSCTLFFIALFTCFLKSSKFIFFLHSFSYFSFDKIIENIHEMDCRQPTRLSVYHIIHVRHIQLVCQLDLVLTKKTQPKLLSHMILVMPHPPISNLIAEKKKTRTKRSRVKTKE